MLSAGQYQISADQLMGVGFDVQQQGCLDVHLCLQVHSHHKGLSKGRYNADVCISPLVRERLSHCLDFVRRQGVWSSHTNMTTLMTSDHSIVANVMGYISQDLPRSGCESLVLCHDANQSQGLNTCIL